MPVNTEKMGRRGRASRAGDDPGDWEDFVRRCRSLLENLDDLPAGDWIVVEVNDGQQSGLCGVPAETLYQGLTASEHLFGRSW